MISSSISTEQYQTSGSDHSLSQFGSSTSLHGDSILAQSLPNPLAAPPGWRTEVITSDSSILTNTGTDVINTNTNYTEYNTSQFNQTDCFDTMNTYNTSSSTTFADNQTDYLQSPAYQDLTTLTREQQQNIINRIEHQHPPPLIINKKPAQDQITYRQNVTIRYLRPPTPPPPGPIIIREVRPPQPPAEPPIKIQQRPPAPRTPPPIVLREQPPSVPPRTPAKVVEKLLPAPPRPPRRVIVERYGECPPKPSDVLIERWLPYKQSGQRRILIERAPPPSMPHQEPNVIVMHDAPHARIHKQFINQGVERADPESYLQRYGSEINTWHGSQHAHLIGEATRAVPPPPVGVSNGHHYSSSYVDHDRYGSSPYGYNSWDRTRVVTPIPRSSSYHYSYSDYDSPNHYCNQSSSRYGLETSRSYGDYPVSRHEKHLTMTDVTPSWNRYCNSSSYDGYSSRYDDYPSRYDGYPSRYDDYSSSYRSSYPTKTIRVGSDNELHHVLSDLTHGHIPNSFRSY